VRLQMEHQKQARGSSHRNIGKRTSYIQSKIKSLQIRRTL